MPRDQRRAQLLDAARVVFTTKGYHAAAMDDIAETAGVSKPVLYQHFASKLELYLGLLDTSLERLVDVVSGALASTDHNADRVAATMDAFWDFVADPGGDYRFVFESDLTGEPEVQSRLNVSHNEICNAIAEVISEDTGLSDDRARLLATALIGISQVTARFWLTDKNNVSLDEAKSMVGSLAWRGMSGFPKTDGDILKRPSA